LKKRYEGKPRGKQPISRLLETQRKTTMISFVKSHEFLKSSEASWIHLKIWSLPKSTCLQVHCFPLEESSTTEASNFLQTSWDFAGVHNRSLSCFLLIFFKKTEHYGAFELISAGSVVLNSLRKEQVERILMLYAQ